MFCRVRAVGYLSLDYCRINNDKQNVAYGFFTDISCYKCGQTSRPVVRAQIQTSCNFKANMCNCVYVLGELFCWLHNLTAE